LFRPRRILPAGTGRVSTDRTHDPAGRGGAHGALSMLGRVADGHRRILPHRRRRNGRPLTTIHQETAMKKIGFVGLGSMGLPMAGRLLDEGYGLVVHDLNAAAVAALVARGVEAAPSPKA